MRITAFLSALCAAAAVHADPRSAQIYIQPITSSSSAQAPSPLAEVSYDPAALGLSSVVSYEAPEIPAAARLVRIGLYDAKARTWTSGTTVAAADNFSKGYSPNIVLSTDGSGAVVSASCKGVAIDAGQTRDFGPKVVVLPETRGKQPQLNKPVVLSPEGKKVEPEPEKSFLQKYGYDSLICVAMGAGANMRQVLVDDWHCCVYSHERRRRRRREIDYKYSVPGLKDVEYCLFTAIAVSSRSCYSESSHVPVMQRCWLWGGFSPFRPPCSEHPLLAVHPETTHNATHDSRICDLNQSYCPLFVMPTA